VRHHDLLHGIGEMKVTLRNWIIGTALLVTSSGGVQLYAQPSRAPFVALSLDMTTGAQDPARVPTIGFGISTRTFDSRTLSVRVSGSMAFPWSTRERLCWEDPCDTRALRRERRIGIDVRRMLDTASLFVHVGLGVSWSRMVGYVSQSPVWNGGSRETPLGFGQLGIGRRSQRAKHTRWVEAGLEHQAGAPNATVYVQAGIGIF